MDTLLQFPHPLRPYLPIHPHHTPLNIPPQDLHSLHPLELQGLRDIVLAVVVSEVEVVEVESLWRSDGHADLVPEEGIIDKIGGVAVTHHHYDATHDLPYLVVDEALPNDVETQEVLADGGGLETDHVTLGLRVLRLQVLGVVVEVVGADEDLAAFVDLFQRFLLLLGRPTRFHHILSLRRSGQENALRANVRVVPGFDHVPDLEAVGHSLEAVVHDLAALEQLLQLQVQSVPVQRLVLQQQLVPHSEKTGNTIDDRMNPLVRPCCS